MGVRPEGDNLTYVELPPESAQRSAQWYIAMAAAAPALMDRVEPYWLIATSCLQTATSSSVSPGPSEPNARQVRRGSS
jgi:hypothetical protein